MICEKCWGDAYLRHLETGLDIYICYLQLLEERKNNPCDQELSGLELCDWFDRAVEEHPIIEHKAYYLKQEYPIEELLDYFGGEDD